MKALELHLENVAGLWNSELDELRERLAGDGITMPAPEPVHVRPVKVKMLIGDLKLSCLYCRLSTIYNIIN